MRAESKTRELVNENAKEKSKQGNAGAALVVYHKANTNYNY